MARITSQDCLERISNHFELVLIASERAKRLGEGMPSFLKDSVHSKKKPEKHTVVALREIGGGSFSVQNFAQYKEFEAQNIALQNNNLAHGQTLESRQDIFEKEINPLRRGVPFFEPSDSRTPFQPK